MMGTTTVLRSELRSHLLERDPAPGERAWYHAAAFLTERDGLPGDAAAEVPAMADARAMMIQLGDLLSTADYEARCESFGVRTDRAIKMTMEQLGHAVDRACTELASEGGER